MNKNQNTLKWTKGKKELIYKLTRNYISVLQDNGVKIRTLKAIKFDRRVNRNGCCTMWRDNNMFVLGISIYRFADGMEAIKETILHELCHAIAPYGEGHGSTWQKIAKLVGDIFHVKINERNPHSIKVAEMAYKYHVKCDGCGAEWHYCRRTKFVKAVEDNHAEGWKCGCGHKHFSMMENYRICHN